MFLNSINNFRAIAILFIVAGHCFYISNIQFGDIWGPIIYNLINGGTVFFVFISGFLFHHLFYSKYEFNSFLKSKFKRLFLPYTILSVAPIILCFKFKPNFWIEGSPTFTAGILHDYATPALKYFLSGEHMVAYWYIPFALLLFLFSPAHIAFIKLNVKIQIGVLSLLFVISSLIHRPSEYLMVFHSLLYFTPVYLFGILCSIHKEAIYLKLKGKDLILLTSALGFAALEVYFGNKGNYFKEFFVFNGVDLMLIQKTLLCVFFMVWLHRYEHFSNKYVNIVATTSFTIFFLHGYFLWILNYTKSYFGIQFSYPWMAYLAISLFLLLISVWTSLIVKKLLPKYSRYIIGY